MDQYVRNGAQIAMNAQTTMMETIHLELIAQDASENEICQLYFQNIYQIFPNDSRKIRHNRFFSKYDTNLYVNIYHLGIRLTLD